MNYKHSVVALVAGLASISAFAADFDGSKRLICATAEARDCVSGQMCFGGLADDVGAPAFIRIDFEKKTIVGPKVTTPVRLMDQDERQLLLQGSELGYAWVFALDRASGKFSASLTDREGAFVLFGSCTPL
jgi:hypothetical protein